MYWFHHGEATPSPTGVNPPFAETIPQNGVNLMRKLAFTLAACLLVGGCLAAPLQAADNKPAPPALKVGDVAPDFKLQYFDGTDLKDVSLSQYRGKKNVVLAFYIFAFTGG
jgi:cytochrome oxidase Cu insertion factor (SCO1/SenC/PrrC family)